MTVYIKLKGVLKDDLPRRIDLEEQPKRDGRIRVSDGSLVDPYNLRDRDMKPMVMINALSQINRFTGHTKYPYSVGQHTRNLTLIVPEHLKRAAILHDMSEAFFNDMASPVKAKTPSYKEAEHEAGIRIFNHFGVGSEEYMELDEFDKRIYANERNALFDHIGESGNGDQRQPLDFHKMPDAFTEQSWRKVRGNLILLWQMYMDDYDIITGDYIHD